MMSMVEKLGASSIAIAYSECYSSLQTGVCDAAENSIVNYLDMSFYEVAPYYIKDDHTRSADILVMSQKTRPDRAGFLGIPERALGQRGEGKRAEAAGHGQG